MTQEDLADRKKAASLVQSGTGDLPAIETALDKLDRGGEYSIRNAGLLLAAYARIAGPAGLRRLRAPRANPKLANWAAPLDSATAIALGITSYVSYNPGDGPVLDAMTCRAPTPADSLDALIGHWLRGDAVGLEANLGPDALASWTGHLQPKEDSLPGTAVGYRFLGAGPWSQPSLNRLLGLDLTGIPHINSPTLDTIFVTASGRGKRSVSFLLSWPIPRYSVNSADISGLLTTIASCYLP